jgi:flagellar motor protein MotB
MISNLVIFFILVATYASKNTETNSMPKKVLDRQVGIFGTSKDRQQESAIPRSGRIAQHGESAPESGSKRRGNETDALKRFIQDKQYRVTPRISDLQDGVRISLDESGAFVAGSDTLSSEGAEIVAEVGRFYDAEPVEFVVEAHTDDRSFRYSRHRSDLDLSRAMALAVANVLARDARVAPVRIGISPMGAAHPLDTNATATGRARNRRVEIVVRSRP